MFLLYWEEYTSDVGVHMNDLQSGLFELKTRGNKMHKKQTYIEYLLVLIIMLWKKKLPVAIHWDKDRI